jgi:hypothetical protein
VTSWRAKLMLPRYVCEKVLGMWFFGELGQYLSTSPVFLSTFHTRGRNRTESTDRFRPQNLWEVLRIVQDSLLYTDMVLNLARSCWRSSSVALRALYYSLFDYYLWLIVPVVGYMRTVNFLATSEVYTHKSECLRHDNVSVYRRSLVYH